MNYKYLLVLCVSTSLCTSFAELKILHTQVQNCKQELPLREKLITNNSWNVTAVYVDSWIDLFAKKLPEFEKQFKNLGAIENLELGTKRQWKKDDIRRMHAELQKDLVQLQESRLMFDEVVSIAEQNIQRCKMHKKLR